MPTVPQYDGPQVKQAGIPDFRQQLDTNVGMFGGNGAAGMIQGGKQMSAMGDELGHRAAILQRAEEAQQLSRVNVSALEAVTKLQTSLEADVDYASVGGKWTKGIEEIKRAHMAGITSGNVEALFENDFAKLAITKGAGVQGAAIKRQAEAGRAEMDRNLDTYAHLAAQATTPAERNAIVTMGRVEIATKLRAGYMHADDAAVRERKFLSRADEAQALRLIQADPETAEKEILGGSMFPSLDEVARSRLSDTAVRRAESIRTAGARDAERLERQAEHRLRLDGDRVVKDLYDKAAKGLLSQADVDEARRHGGVSPSEYNGLRHALTPNADTQKDDPAVLSALLPRLHAEDVATDLTREFTAGRLSGGTYRGLMSQNAAALRDDQPASPYKSGRELVATTLNPGQLLSGPAESVARAGMAQALVEFDTWAVANPAAKRTEMVAEAQNVVKRYQVVQFEQLSLATGLPRFYGGTRDSMTAKDLDAAEQRILAEMDAGRMPREVAQQELRKTETWREIMRRRPTAMPTK